MCLVRIMHLCPITPDTPNLIHTADAEVCVYTLLLSPPSLSSPLIFSMYSTTCIYACMYVCVCMRAIHIYMYVIYIYIYIYKHT